jgi:hypothetical protein
MITVKVIPVLLATLATAMAAPTDPGASALHFLEKVRTKKVNLEPGADTALAPQTSEKKRKEIARRLDRMARDLGTDPLEVGEVKMDGDFAAVLVRKIGGFDPSRLQVFPVALVKRGAEWAAAPVPASFENSGVGYAIAMRKRLESLEQWMLSQRVLDLEQLREESTARMRKTIEESLTAETLRGLNSQQVGERFISACENRNLPEVLGLLGGLSQTLPSDWANRLRAADSALQEASVAARPWRLLVAPEVLRVPVYHEDDGDDQTALLSIGCMDPVFDPNATGFPKVELVHLALEKSKDGLWRIDPPDAFFLGESEDDAELNEDLDSDLLDLFPSKLSMKYPVSPGKTAREAADSLLSALGKSKPDWVGLVSVTGEPEDCRKRISRCARFWWDSLKPSTARIPTPLAFHEKENRAVSMCQFFDPRNPDRLDLRLLYFEKTSMGWFWDAQPSDETRDSLEAWTEAETAKWQQSWQESLLADTPVVDELKADSAPSAEEGKQVVSAWLKTILARDLRGALKLTARLQTPLSQSMLLRNLGFEFTGARQLQQSPQLLSAHRGDRLTGIGAKVGEGGKSSFPFYSVITTPSGPRILLETDLLASDNRTREYLNGDSNKRLREFSEPAAEELKKLFSDFQHTAKKSEAP